jgi:methionine aminotransferase
LLKETRFEFTPAGGTYFQTVSYDAITDEADTDFAVRLTEEYGVATIPVSVFYHNEANKTDMLRFCFAKEKDELSRAIEKLVKI